MAKIFRTSNPIQDAEDYANRERELVGYCETCGRAIYKDEDHYNIDGTFLCDDYDCTSYWLKQFKINS